MRPPKYALEPLARLRQHGVDEAVRGLATAVARRDEAERRRRGAEQRRELHESATALVREDEREALARGELRAADLARADAWERRASAEGTAMAAECDRARTSEATALEQEQRARTQVATREADAQVVARDRARWDEGLRKRTEAREEEAMAEAYRPKR
ncbi:MAG TPA: hypothetical protein VIF15_21610 [Polyangiaceae bacterium]|jgi:hypothetical protein